MTLDELLAAESIGACAYWASWASLPISWVPRELDRIPEHWRTFGSRTSPISDQRRHPASPGGALAAYLYRLLEAETTLAIHAAGMDPGIGIWHRDEPGRDSLSLDVMEAARPAADAYLLTLLRDHRFRAPDFHETRRGLCRILPPLTHRLAETMPLLAAAVEPIVNQVGKLLDQLPTSAQYDGVRFSRSRKLEHRRTITHTPSASPRIRGCRTCGEILPGDQREPYCESCAPSRSTSAAAEHQAAGSRVPQARRESLRRQRLAALDWDRRNPQRPDPSIFERDILPRLEGVSYSALNRRTGLSRRYCKMIATGEKVPHPRHWAAFLD
jgi:CRISPR associated protein Cas1